MKKAKIKILYAEDDEIRADLVKFSLEKEDFEVILAPDGDEAWIQYNESKPDILLVDLVMPGKDGLELIQSIREHNQQTYIVVYTVHGEAEKEVASLDAGADQFISKERSLEVLSAYMKRIREKIETYTNIPYLYQLSSTTTYNSITRELHINGQIVRLRGTEGRFLQLLCAKNHEVASKSYLIHGIWGNANKNKASELKKYASLVRSYLKSDSSLQIEFRDGGYMLF